MSTRNARVVRSKFQITLPRWSSRSAVRRRQTRSGKWSSAFAYSPSPRTATLAFASSGRQACAPPPPHQPHRA